MVWLTGGAVVILALYLFCPPIETGRFGKLIAAWVDYIFLKLAPPRTAIYDWKGCCKLCKRRKDDRNVMLL